MEKNLSCGEISPHDRLSCGQILHMTDCPVGKNSSGKNFKWEKFPLMRIVKTSVMWRNNVYNLSSIFCCFVVKSVIFNLRCFIGFVAMYTLLRGEKLSQKL